MRLAILHHDCSDLQRSDRYLIHSFIPYWKEAGVEVIQIAGTRHLPPADVALLHVDLSRVPQRFRKAAESYPKAMNSKLLDIRKRSLPHRHHLVSSPSEYQGPVLVKTDFNYAGRPERTLYRRGTSGLPWLERWALFRDSRGRHEKSYAFYAASIQVPRAIWKNRHLVVEQFLPEMEDGHYVLRWAFFLGHAHVGLKGFGKEPVVRMDSQALPCQTPQDIHPDVLRYRQAIGLDYGKIDYVLHQGKPVILDVNKTIGGAGEEENARVHMLVKSLAYGLFAPS